MMIVMMYSVLMAQKHIGSIVEEKKMKRRRNEVSCRKATCASTATVLLPAKKKKKAAFAPTSRLKAVIACSATPFLTYLAACNDAPALNCHACTRYLYCRYATHACTCMKKIPHYRILVRCI